MIIKLNESEQELIDYRLECADFAMYDVVQRSYIEIVSDNTNGKYEVRYNDMTVTVEFILDQPWSKYCYTINEEGPFSHDSYEYIPGDIMDYIDSKLDESCHSKKATIKEDNEFEQYTYVRSKEVRDSDGYLTEYTMYFDEVNDRYVFVFGDSDLYNPNDGYEEFDWECDSESEANDWFDDYEGFEDDLDEACNLKEDDNSYLRYKVKLTPYKNMFKFDFVDDYFDKSDYCFCNKNGYVETDYSGCSENFFNKLWNKDMKPNKVYGVYTDGPNGKVLYFKEIPSNWFK